MVRARLSTLLIAALASTALAGAVQATTITQADLTQGANSVTVGGFTVTTTGDNANTTGFFDHKTGGTPSATGVGVSGNGSVVNGEIDNNEKITFTSILGPAFADLLRGRVSISHRFPRRHGERNRAFGAYGAFLHNHPDAE